MLSLARFVRFTACATFLAAAALGVAQTQPSLQITSPADGSSVNPGSAVSFSVSTPTGTAFSAVGVIGEEPLGVSGVTASLPAQFTLAIPSQLALRQYAVTAMGVTVAGASVESDPVNIDVERSDMPLSFSTQAKWLTLEAAGQSIPTIVVASFSDGSNLDVTQSTNVTYQSTNTSIASVDNRGMVTGLAAGATSVTITYRNTNGPNLQLSIPVTVLPPLLTVAPAALDFGSVNVGSNANLALTLTNSSASDNSLTVSAITVGGGNYTETDNCLSSSPLQVGASCAITVTFAPSGSGQSPGALSIANSAGIVPTVIPLAGLGVITAPVINGILPTSGATGANVTISGAAFGATQGTSTVTFNGTTATTAGPWSDTSITAVVPVGATTGNVVVTTAGGSSNGVLFTIVPVPHVTSLTPSSGAIGASVVIAGSGFGATQGTSTVTFNGTTATTVGPWSDTSITAVVPVGATTGNVVVTTAGGSSNGLTFTVTSSTPGCPCTIWNPGSAPSVPDGGPDSSVELGVKFRSDVDGFINGIRFYKATANTGTHVANLWSLTGTLLATATFNNETSSGWQEVSFASPVPVNADTTYIASYFAPNAHYAFDTNYFASIGVDNQMLHALIDSRGVDGGDGVYAYGNTSNFPNLTYFATNYWVDVAFSPNTNASTNPSITNLSSGAGVVGKSVTITGAHFGSIQGTSIVKFNGTVAAPIAWHATSIVVPVPTGATTGNVVVTVNGVASNPATFTVTSTAACPCTIWSSGSVPTVADAGPDFPVELGIKFRSDVDGFINGIRFYKSSSNTGIHVANLWSATGTLLATATFMSETGAGWQEVSFPLPVAVTANTTYVASYFAPSGHYALDASYFSADGVDNQVLHALISSTDPGGGNGVYAYGSNSNFPNQTGGGNNFWVDVVFQPQQ
jgi:hypothetical protein